MDSRGPKKPHCQCSKKCNMPPIKSEPFCEYHKMNGCGIISPTTGSEPDNNILEEYNKNPNKRESHNCYSFAAMINDLEKINKCSETKNCNVSFHSPGNASGQGRVKNKHCSIILGRTISDIPESEHTVFNQKCPVGYSKIAVVTDEKHDFHYYLQLKNGKWAHKPGGTAATLLDSNKSEIYNPELAGRYYPPNHEGDHELDYKNFCGFLCVPRNKPIKLKGGRKTRSKKRVRTNGRNSASRSKK